jgi:hypothetical protein
MASKILVIRMAMGLLPTTLLYVVGNAVEVAMRHLDISEPVPLEDLPRLFKVVRAAWDAPILSCQVCGCGVLVHSLGSDGKTPFYGPCERGHTSLEQFEAMIAE